MKRHLQILLLPLLLSAEPGWAQSTSQEVGEKLRDLQLWWQRQPPASAQRGRVPLPGAAVPQTSNAWWTDTALVERLGLTADQRKKVEGVFEKYRESMFDSRANLEKEEALLVPMLAAESLEAAKILSQIDRIVQLRGEMEKVYARMTLEIRQCLSRSQWIQLQQVQQVRWLPQSLDAYRRAVRIQ